MDIQLKAADINRETQELFNFDRTIFSSGDGFAFAEWAEFEVFWIVVCGERVGVMAFLPNAQCGDFYDSENIACKGCLWLTSIGILPEHRHKGIGQSAMALAIHDARGRYERLSSNCRASNAVSAKLHANAGFSVTARMSDYYQNPAEDALVLDLLL